MVQVVMRVWVRVHVQMRERMATVAGAECPRKLFLVVVIAAAAGREPGAVVAGAVTTVPAASCGGASSSAGVRAPRVVLLIFLCPVADDSPRFGVVVGCGGCLATTAHGRCHEHTPFSS